MWRNPGSASFYFLSGSWASLPPCNSWTWLPLRAGRPQARWASTAESVDAGTRSWWQSRELNWTYRLDYFYLPTHQIAFTIISAFPNICVWTRWKNGKVKSTAKSLNAQEMGKVRNVGVSVGWWSGKGLRVRQRMRDFRLSSSGESGVPVACSLLWARLRHCDNYTLSACFIHFFSLRKKSQNADGLYDLSCQSGLQQKPSVGTFKDEAKLSKIKKLAQLESFEALHLTALYFPFELLGLTLLTTVLMNKESGRGSHVIALFQEPGI